MSDADHLIRGREIHRNGGFIPAAEVRELAERMVARSIVTV
jgi:hypothetical protein